MLSVKTLGTGRSRISQPPTPSKLIGGLFATAFGLVMLFHPQGWTDGTLQDGVKRMADPNLIRAIGTAILVVGVLLLFLKVTYVVNRGAGLITEQWRLIVPLHFSAYALSDFSDVRIVTDKSDIEAATYRLCLVGAARSVCLASSRRHAALTASRNLVQQATGIGA